MASGRSGTRTPIRRRRHGAPPPALAALLAAALLWGAGAGARAAEPKAGSSDIKKTIASQKEGEKVGGKGLVDEELAKNPTFLFRVALRLFQRGLYVRALPLLSQFVRDFPKHPDHRRAVYMLGDAHFFIANTGIPAEFLNAINIYQLAVRLYPQAPQMPSAYFRIGTAFKKRKMPGEALGAFRLLLEKAPNSPQAPRAQLEIARRYLDLNDPQSAVVEFQRLLKRYPGSPQEKEAYFGIADAQFRLAKYKSAYQQFEGGKKRWPGYLRLQANLLYNYAETLFQTKRFRRAADAFLEMVNIDPSNEFTHRALARLGDLYLREGRRVDAIKVYERVLKIHPRTEGALVARIRLADLGVEGKVKIPKSVIFSLDPFYRPLEAYRSVAKRAAGRPLGQVAALRVASYFLGRGKVYRAIDSAREFLKKYPASPLENNANLLLAKAHFGLIGRFYQRRQYLRAIRTYVEFRSLVPARVTLQADPFKTMLQVGDCYMRLGLYPQAIKMFEKILEQPEGVLSAGAEALFRLAHATLLLGDREKAKAIGERFLAGFPKDPRVASIQAILGEIAWKSGQPRRAAVLLAAAVGGRLENELRGRALFLLAEANAQIGRYDEAAEAMGQAIALYPEIQSRIKPFSQEQAVYRLGDILYEGRKWLSALLTYNNALVSFPRSELSGWAIHRVARIQAQLELAKRGGKVSRAALSASTDPFWREMNRIRDESLKWDQVMRPKIESFLRQSGAN